MKTYLQILVAVLCALTLSACATVKDRELSPSAYKGAKERISILHPIEDQKRGIEKVVYWQSIMPAELRVEFMNGLFGAWPVLGDRDGQKIEAQAYSYRGFTDPLCRKKMQYKANFSLAELENVPFVLNNQDIGFAFKLSGEPIIEIEKRDGKIEVINPFEPTRFETDVAYRQDFLKKYGMTLRQLQSVYAEAAVTEYLVGSVSWAAMVEDFNKLVDLAPPNTILQSYKKNGEIRVGGLSLQEYAIQQSKLSSMDAGSRTLKRSSVSAAMLLAGGVGLWAPALVSVSATAAKASLDNEWSEMTARSVMPGYAQFANFRSTEDECAEIILKNLKRNETLTLENIDLRARLDRIGRR